MESPISLYPYIWVLSFTGSGVEGTELRVIRAVMSLAAYSKRHNCTLILKEEQRLRVFGNRVLRKKFGHKREEVTGNWRKLHNEEIRNLFTSPDIIIGVKSRRMRRAGKVARLGHKSNALAVLVGKPEGNRLLGKPKN